MPIIYRYRSKDFAPEETGVVREQPLSIVVNGRELATLMSTPVKLDCLVLGFLSFEGIIRGLEDITHLEVSTEEGLAEVRLRGTFTPPKRQIYTSGCSGGVTFSNALLDHAPVLLERMLDPDKVFPLMRLLYEAATLYQQTRGVHAAALADDEKLLIVAEDVGRHNALDKIRGEAMLREIETTGRILLSTGRISSEMLRKGAHMGIPFIISRTSPTSLSVEGAKRLGITLIGYVRGDGFNLYSHPERMMYSRHARVTVQPD